MGRQKADLNSTEFLWGLLFVVIAGMGLFGVLLIIRHHAARKQGVKKKGKMLTAEMDLAKEISDAGRVIYYADSPWKDFWFFLKNNMIQISIFRAHRMSPFSREERLMVYAVVLAFTFFTSTVIQLIDTNSCYDCTALSCGECLSYEGPEPSNWKLWETTARANPCGLCFSTDPNSGATRARCYDKFNPSTYFPEDKKLRIEEKTALIDYRDFCLNSTFPIFRENVVLYRDDTVFANDTMCWPGSEGLQWGYYNTSADAETVDPEFNPYHKCLARFSRTTGVYARIVSSLGMFIFQAVLVKAARCHCLQNPRIGAFVRSSAECMGHYFIFVCAVSSALAVVTALTLLLMRNLSMEETFYNFLVSQAVSVGIGLITSIYFFRTKQKRELARREAKVGKRNKWTGEYAAWEEPRTLKEMELEIRRLRTLSVDPYLLRVDKKPKKNRPKSQEMKALKMSDSGDGLPDIEAGLANGSGRSTSSSSTAAAAAAGKDKDKGKGKDDKKKRRESSSSIAANKATAKLQAEMRSRDDGVPRLCRLTDIDQVDIEQHAAGALIQALFHTHEGLSQFVDLRDGESHLRDDEDLEAAKSREAHQQRCKEEAAAESIQRAYRLHAERAKAKKERGLLGGGKKKKSGPKSEEDAAVTIQAAYRGHNTRKNLKK